MKNFVAPEVAVKIWLMPETIGQKRKKGKKSVGVELEKGEFIRPL